MAGEYIPVMLPINVVRDCAEEEVIGRHALPIVVASCRLALAERDASAGTPPDPAPTDLPPIDGRPLAGFDTVWPERNAT